MAHSNGIFVGSLYAKILDDIFIISGFPNDLLSVEFMKRLETVGVEKLIIEIISDIQSIDLDKIDQHSRIYLFETAIKSGNLDIVKALSEKFFQQEYQYDIIKPFGNYSPKTIYNSLDMLF